MSKFNKLFNKIISECKVIVENGFPNRTADIQRPARMKTPENYYGSTGGNAKEYDLYIQDEAEAVFQDKYGSERGTKMWEGILSVGNAMWKACDEILGERLSMEYDLTQWFKKHSDIAEQCTDRKQWIDNFIGFYEGSYIVNWTWWILIQIIDNKHFTSYYIETCMPTFKGVAEVAPITTNVLLNLANIKLIDEPIQQQEELPQQEIVPNEEPIEEPVQEPIQKPIPSSAFELNGDKDHDRIIGILNKSRLTSRPSAMDNTYRAKAIQLANSMNNKITDPAKRIRRRQACLDLGLDWLADCFQ